MWEDQEDPIKASQRKYRESEKGKEAAKRSRDNYAQSERGKEAIKKAQAAYEKSEKAKLRRAAYLSKPEVRARKVELAKLRHERIKAQRKQENQD